MLRLMAFAALILVFNQCATRISKSRTAATYAEDVSALRPEFPVEAATEIEENQTAVVLEKAPYTAPRYDVTEGLEAALEKNAEQMKSIERATNKTIIIMAQTEGFSVIIH